MNLVLFGAGASHGSVDVHPHKPPLGNTIFSELEALGGIAARIPEEIKAVFRKSFEEGMDAYVQFAKDDTGEFQRELAGYLLNFTPGPENTYRKFVQEIGTQHVVYSSLNYDLLFELAVGESNIQYGRDRRTHIPMYKIHGSCNFWPDFGDVKIINCKLMGRIADAEGPVKIISRTACLEEIKNASFAPAIAQFREGKPTKICPRFVDHQLRQWTAEVSRARRIAIIGVKVHQPDSHIWEPLGEAKADIWYVGFDQDRDAFNEWKNMFPNKNRYFIPSDFENCAKIIKKRFLVK